MQTNFYYIHGLHGSNKSAKFLELQNHYPNIECLSWKIDDNIELKILEWRAIIKPNLKESICIIASSTGANFAYQLQLMLNANDVKIILINPLLAVECLYDMSILPSSLIKFIFPIKQVLPTTLLFFSQKDTVIDHSTSYFEGQQQVIVCRNSTHRFEFLNNFKEKIDLFCAKTILYQEKDESFYKVQRMFLKSKLQSYFTKLQITTNLDYLDFEIVESLKSSLLKSKEAQYKMFLILYQFNKDIPITSENYYRKEQIWRFLVQQEQYITFTMQRAVKAEIMKLEIELKNKNLQNNTNYVITHEIRKLVKASKFSVIDIL